MPIEPSTRVREDVVLRLREMSKSLIKATEAGDFLRTHYFAKQIDRMLHHSVSLNHEAGSF